jgi:hypothetical protein
MRIEDIEARQGREPQSDFSISLSSALASYRQAEAEYP